MFEFIARLVLTALLASAVFLSAPTAMSMAGQIAAGYAAWSLFLMLLDRRGIRSPGLATFASLIDSALVASAIATLGRTDALAVLAAFPMAYAVRMNGAAATTLAPLSGAIVIASYNLLAQSPLSVNVLLQGLAAAGLTVMAAPQTVITTQFVQSEPEFAAEEPPQAADGELKESYRRLREHTHSSESKHRKARWAMQLFEAVHDESGAALANLATSLREITGASGLTLYTAHAAQRSLIVQAVSGDVPASMRIQKLPLGRDLTGIVGANQGVHQFEGSESAAFVGTIQLKVRQKLVGMIWVCSESEAVHEESLRRAQECAEFVAALMHRENENVHLKARLSETEVMYQVSSTSIGSETPRTLMARIVRDMGDFLGADHFSAQILDEKDTLIVASHGVPMRWVDSMSFAKGPGISGWLELGAPDLILTDTHGDARCRKEEALKRRIACYCFVPIRVGEQVYGALAAGSHRVGGVPERSIDALKLVAGEIGLAIERLEGSPAPLCGLVTPHELQEALATEMGSLIVLDPLRKEEFKREHGADGLELCIRKFAARLRAIAPSGSLVCRRENDIVVFVPNTQEAFARTWANEAAATAAMTHFRSTDGSKSLPFAVRAKVSAYHPVESRAEIDDENTSSLSFPA